MILWEIKSKNGELGGYIPDLSLSRKLSGAVHPSKVRHIFEGERAIPVSMQLAKPSGNSVEQNRLSLPDLVLWSWIAMFSERVVSVAINMGCVKSEFWPCRFQTNPDQNFFFYLPERPVDIVDVGKSTFRQVLPVTPPLPLFLDRLVTKAIPRDLPPCFWSDRPDRQMVFSELIVRDDFKSAWEDNKFVGAEFRQLTE